MKRFLILILFILASVNLWAQTEIGIGLVQINFDDKTIVNFYNSPQDKKPVKTLQFFNDTEIDSWNIRDLEKQKIWLKPEVLWIDYSSLVFRCTEIRNNWYKIIVNNQSGQIFWIQKKDQFKFETWETFLKEMFSIYRTDGQKIRKSPLQTSDEIIYNGEDCFKVKSMKGDWIEISTTDSCEEEKNNIIKSGWIKWRNENTLLINYFITS